MLSGKCGACVASALSLCGEWVVPVWQMTCGACVARQTLPVWHVVVFGQEMFSEKCGACVASALSLCGEGIVPVWQMTYGLCGMTDVACVAQGCFQGNVKLPRTRSPVVVFLSNIQLLLSYKCFQRSF